MKKFMLLAVLLIIGLTFLSAQTIAEYTFSTTTDGTLEDMTGSTDLLTAGSYYDDNASPVTNIGFTFGFGLGAYTQFSANSNGQMRLGSTAITGGNITPTASTPLLAPLSGDNAIRATGRLHYKVVGSEPNRKLVVEWLDLRVNYSSSAETGTYCRIQAWLYEGSNNIKFVYGTMWNMSTSTQARGVYISTSNAASSVGNVTDIINTMTWTTNGTGVLTTTFPASSAMANLNSAADGARRVFNFNYPDPNAVPNSAALVSPLNGGYALLTDILQWRPNGGYVTSYDVYFGTSATPPFVVNQGSSSYTPTLLPGTTYYWKIVARNANGAATPTATWSFTTPTSTQLAESFENTTFPPAGWANPGAWSRSTSTYNHGLASAYKYPNDSALYILSTPKLTITGTSTLSFLSYCSTNSTSAVWDVVYSTDRVTWTQVPGSSFTHPTASVWVNRVINLSSLAGNNYYLGIRAGGYSYASYYFDKVLGPEITPEAPGAPTLSTPADLAINVNDLPTLTWAAPSTGGVPTGYRLYVGTTNPPTTQVVEQVGLTYTYTTPLAYNTTYYWTVAAYNGAGAGPQATVRSFTTRTDPTIYTIPFTDGFEAGNNDATAVASWSNVYVTGTKNWTANSTATSYNRTPRTGTFNAFLGWSASTWMIRPVQLTGGISYSVEVYARQDMADVTLANMTIAYGNAATAAAMTNVIVPQTGLTSGDYQRLYGSFTPSSTGIYYLGILGTLPSSTNWYVSIDDVTIMETPAAPIFSVSPTSWDFGPQSVNASVTKQFVIANTGGGNLNLSSVVVTGTYYTLSEAPTDMSLSGGESTTFTVRYLPTAIGNHSGNIAVTDGRTVTNIPLSGSAALLVNMTNGSKNIQIGETWNFFDSGGSAATYQASENYTYTFNPPTGYRVVATFTAFATESGYDYLKVYDGTTISDPLLGNYSGTVTEFTHTATSALTFVFTSDTSLQYNGWVASVSVIPQPAGPPEAVTLSAPANGAVDLPASGFNLTWVPSISGGTPTNYMVYISENENALTSEEGYETTSTSFNPVTEAAFEFTYETMYYWTVKAMNGDGEALPVEAFHFTIESDPTVYVPPTYLTDFETWPPINWNMTGGTGTILQYTDGTGNKWARYNYWSQSSGITDIMTTPVMNASQQVVLEFTWSHVYSSSYPDDYLAVEASTDHTNWTSLWTKSNTALNSADGAGNTAPGTGVTETIVLPYINTNFWIRFNGISGWGPDLFIDNVTVKAPPAHDVAVFSYDVPVQVVTPNTVVTPMATVVNNGMNTETFTVTCQIGSYSNIQTVTGLVMGATQQVTFASLTPLTNTAQQVTITTTLASDEVAANNSLTNALICINLDTPALANNAQTDQFVQFNLSDPGTLTPLPTGYTGSYFISGADWMNGNWMGVEYDDASLATDNYYEIDPVTGVYLPSLGEPGQALMGIAWDDTNSIMYGVTGTTGQLCTLNPSTGLATVLGTMWYNLSGTPTNLADIGGLMIDIAYDNTNNILYGIDLGNDCLWTINPTTWELTLKGYFGVDLNYAQDAAFDQDNGLLFLAGYSSFGGLYWIDTTYGGAYLIGSLGTNGYELDGFAIPYGTLAAAPVVSMTGAGVLSWEPVMGAISYNVYSSSDPYGTFTFESNVRGTTYTNTTAPMKFYKVTAVGGRAISNRQPINYSQPMINAATPRNGQPLQTGTVQQSMKK